MNELGVIRCYKRGSYLKSFKKLVIRALSHLKNPAIASCFKSSKEFLLVY